MRDDIVSIIGTLIPFCMIILINRALKKDIIQKNKFKRKMFRNMHFIDKHKEFEDIYNNIKNEINFKEVKAEGRKNILKVLLGIGIIILGLFIAIVLAEKFNSGIAIIWFIICTIIGTIIVYTRTYKSKSLVIKNIMSMIKPGIEYDDYDKKYIALNFYHQSGFRDHEFNREYVTDYIKYELSYGTVVEMADIHLQYYEDEKTVWDGDSYSKLLEVFEGIIVKVTREKESESEILIERNKFFKGEGWTKSQNVGFERLFDMYVKDKGAIEDGITLQLQNEIVELYKKYGIMFEISIKDKSIFIRFFTGGLFESMCFGTLYSKRKLYREYVIFTNILEIIDRLDSIL